MQPATARWQCVRLHNIILSLQPAEWSVHTARNQTLNTLHVNSRTVVPRVGGGPCGWEICTGSTELASFCLAAVGLSPAGLVGTPPTFVMMMMAMAYHIGLYAVH